MEQGPQHKASVPCKMWTYFPKMDLCIIVPTDATLPRNDNYRADISTDEHYYTGVFTHNVKCFLNPSLIAIYSSNFYFLFTIHVLSGPAFTGKPDCQSLRDRHQAFVAVNKKLLNVDDICTFLGETQVTVNMNCTIEFEELRNQMSPLLYSLNEQLSVLRGSPVPTNHQSLKRSLSSSARVISSIGTLTATVLNIVPHPFAQLGSKFIFGGSSLLSYFLQSLDETSGGAKVISRPVFNTSAIANLKLNSTSDVYYLENPWLHFSEKLKFKSVASNFIRFRSDVNRLLSVTLPIISKLKLDRRPLSNSILEKIHGKPFVKIDTFDGNTAKLKRSFIWTQPKKDFPFQKYCIVSLQHRIFLRQGPLTMNSTHTDYLSCIKSLQSKVELDKHCYIEPSVPSPFDIFPFELRFHRVSVVRVTRGKLVYVSCKTDSEAWSNTGIIVLLVSMSCLVKIDHNIIQMQNPNISSDMTFHLLVNKGFAFASQKEFVSEKKNNLEMFFDQQKTDLRNIVLHQNDSFSNAENVQNDDIDLLKIFDIGIAAAFGTTALALIVLFWKLLTKTKHVKENCHELQTFLQ